MSKVTLIHGHERVEIDAEEGVLLGDVVAAADFPFEQPCAGRGTCGRCKMLVEFGGSNPDEVENEYLTPGELALGTRLACRATVQGETQIVLSPIEIYSNKVFKGSQRHRRERDILLGLAIDLGSTTVAAYLVMLDNGEVVAGGAAINQQRIYGADIISRLHAALESETARLRLQRLAVSSINQAIGSLKLSKKVIQRVKTISVVGNVAMHHLLAKLPIESIATMPFQPHTLAGMPNAPGLLDEILTADVQVKLPPVVGGFVGSDALACLAYFDFDKPKMPQLAVDLGTNGEILLTDGVDILTASTAAGPAFEGVNISCGMRASDGAIVDASLVGDQFTFTTINNEPPKGLTGSGLLKVVHELVKAGVIAPSGRIVREPPVMKDMLELEKKPRRIYLTPERNVWLTQMDIRELQKAKGAIRAAISVLMKALNMKPDALERIILTGSFGGQLFTDSVIALGMIPEVSSEKVHNIPNGAGLGAALFLSEEGFSRGTELAKRSTQVDLDHNADFQEIFVEALAFKAG